MNAILQARGLCKSYSSGPVLHGLDLDVYPGKIVGVVGPNGCGKTTMFKIFAGLINDYTGTVTIDGQPVGVHSKSITSFLPEKNFLDDSMKIIGMLNYFTDFYADFDRAKALEMVERFQLDPAMKIKTMSKGMQEKFQLALVMSRAAKLYILDEPLNGIDPAARDSILDIILKNYSENSAVLLSTHLIYDVERIFDYVVMMRMGHIIASGDADEMREKSGKSLNDYFREVFRC